MLHEQEREIGKEKLKKEEKHAALNNHSRQLRQQIQARERERMDERRAFFEESEHLTAEHEEHERKLMKVRSKMYFTVPYLNTLKLDSKMCYQVIDQKLDELRKAGIEEKYISEVVRKMHQPKRLTD